MGRMSAIIIGITGFYKNEGAKLILVIGCSYLYLENFQALVILFLLFNFSYR